ncbi:TLR4 interactor with leucine rich repeats-like [Bacillus rossius redtenbacheri]|uniref:TLR4 interactor with leucine rich repeats-like n=1 Tax=Bacillus rossius redtenbacheri TaxID=93214 RepID=UPI002FDCEB92
MDSRWCGSTQPESTRPLSKTQKRRNSIEPPFKQEAARQDHGSTLGSSTMGSHRQIVTKASFAGLRRLQELAVRDLPLVERFDADSLASLPALAELDVQTWPRIERFRFRLGNVLSGVPSLRGLVVDVKEPELKDQLLGAFDSRLQRLDIRGEGLRRLDGDSLEGIGNNHELVLRIRGTQIKELPRGLFSELQRVSHLTVDISNNQFSSFKLSTIFANSTTWENMGTNQISGGLVLNGNLWVCDCSIVTVGQWTRRWLRETAQTQSAVLRDAPSAMEQVKRATCTDPISGRELPIVRLYPEQFSCQVEAASTGVTVRALPLVLLLCVLC